ncbi:carbohydrate kinase family protein [Streptomyces sp. CS113]|uniref:carbohydrate kinase family protein n=1 Tax=Streptomyces sp. CS113 TaxID=1982761 RepID=UPI000B40F47D|nr:carbohydrate kinase family protein [Streptomyces sp. CS113]OWA09005.1 carbohydrate kinase family protein [Streptomyces sp. CS113]
MRIAVTGSIATDHLMTFPGRFTEQLVADRLDTVALSFLVDDLTVRDGGVAANIAYGLGLLGIGALLVGAAGADFDGPARRLRAVGVDTSAVSISATRHTARFVCTTDLDQNQIATFYAGAMAEAEAIDLAAVARRHGPFDLVLVGADAPAAMVRHTRACRSGSVPFAADPSQQLARLGRAETRELVTGARFLFTNAYEAALLRERTGWTEAEVLERVGVWVTTRGADGVDIARRGTPTQSVPAVPVAEVVDPTGGGDAFRAGFLAGLAHGLPLDRAARLGCAVAARALGCAGTQEYTLDPATLPSFAGRGALATPAAGSPAATAGTS